MTAVGRASGSAWFTWVEARVGQCFAAVVVPETNVTEGGHPRVAALNFREAGIVLYTLAAVADNPPTVHDDAGVAVRPLLPARPDDDVSRRSRAHGDLVEPFVMQQGGPKNRGAEDMLWRRAQNDSLVGRLCEDEGNGQRILRKAYGWPPWVLGGHADALECRLGDLHPLKSYQFSSARLCAGPVNTHRRV